MLAGITNVLIRATGGDPDQEFDTVQSDELQLIVSLSASEGGIEKYPAQLIDRVLAFQNRTVKDAMVPRTQIVALELADRVDKILEVANESGHSRLPVYRENIDEMVGVLHVGTSRRAVRHSSRPSRTSSAAIDESFCTSH